MNIFEESEQSWIKCITWSKCPIGCFINNNININLELPKELDDPVFLKKNGIYQIPITNQPIFIENNIQNEINTI